jgi:hypothetical protein
MCKVYLPGNERSLQDSQEFEVGRFTVLFGKNNAGKTNLLEDIYLMLATRPPGDGEARIRRTGSSIRLPEPGGDQAIGHPVGALYVELEPDFDFDRTVLDAFPVEWEPVDEGVIRFGPLPPRQVCYAATDREYTELWFTDPQEFYEHELLAEGFSIVLLGDKEGDEDLVYEIDEQQRSGSGPIPQPLFLGWEFGEVDTWVTSAMAELTALDADLYSRGLPRTVWFEPPNEGSTQGAWQVRTEIHRRLDQLATLATDLLPDFLDGSIQAAFRMPGQWDESPEIQVTYHERPNSDGRPLEHFGRGASRWMGIAVQIALRLMRSTDEVSVLGAPSSPTGAGHVLFIDEPEAHLHHSAVASVVRWCHRVVGCGFNLVAASHHEEFLRASGDDVTFVKVTRDFADREVFRGWGGLVSDEPPSIWTTPSTTARTIATTASSTLQELAEEIGLHPASALSLHRAILFVEGPLDEAVLDEYAGGALDAAGVTIIPIHGTKNLEGLIDGEFTTRLGIKTGMLTDNTVTATMWDRSNKKRKQEEKKLIRLVERFEERGLPPPTVFGVSEQDLLFALPVAAVRKYLGGPFPEWHELLEECRLAEGRSKSESVNWKAYALEQYGLPLITAEGVRRIVRALDLDGVELPSVRSVISEVIAWANDRDPAEPSRPFNA